MINPQQKRRQEFTTSQRQKVEMSAKRMRVRKMSKHATDTDEETLDESVWEVLTLNKMAERERGGEGGTGVAMPICPPHRPGNNRLSRSQHWGGTLC